MSDIEKLIRPDLIDFAAYRATANRETLGDAWLNSNESPFDNNYLLDNLSLNRYPARRPEFLLQALADFYKTKSAQIIPGRGTDEAIDLLIRLFCRPQQDQILTCDPTFSMYQIYGKISGVETINIPLSANDDFRLPLEKILAAYNSKVKIIFLCSPNNPTGNCFSREEILTLCSAVAKDTILVIDEAYIEFSDEESFTSVIDQFSNLVILRTMSKAFGLAGARCGVAIANTEIIEWLYKIAAPYPLPTPIIAAAQMALTLPYIQKIQTQIKSIIQTKEWLQQQLLSLPTVLKVWPSQANFLLIKTLDSKKIVADCLKNNIIIRDFGDATELNHCVRITIGTEEQAKRVVEVFKNF